MNYVRDMINAKAAVTLIAKQDFSQAAGRSQTTACGNNEWNLLLHMLVIDLNLLVSIPNSD